MTAQPSILVGTANRTVWVRVEGKGSFLNSTGLKEFAKEMINRGFREFVVDLKNCPVMDSTFMGTLAGIALRLRELGQGQLRVINLNERNSDLLAQPRARSAFHDRAASDDAAARCRRRSRCAAAPTDKAAQAQTMLEAHEAVRGGESGERREVQRRARVSETGPAPRALS